MLAQKIAISLQSSVVRLIISIFLLLTLASPALAQASPSAALPTTIPPTSPLYTDLLIHNMFHTFSCLAIGQSMIGQPCLTYKVTKNAQGMIQGVPILSSAKLSGGVLGSTASLIDALYANPPISTSEYFASVGQGLGIIKEARAQGVVGSGQQVLSPIISLWQVSRNIAYLIMIIVFVIIGVMVIFRQKINPQTVITAQAALPGLVLGLILITFSYFFASLITDTAFISINLVGSYFAAAQGNPPQNLLADISGKNIVEIFSKFIGTTDYRDAIANVVTTVFNNVGPSAQNFIRWAAGIMAFQQANMIGHAFPIIGDLVGIIVGLVAGGVVAADAAPIIAFFLQWALVGILLYSMIKLLLRLVNSYLNIIFLTITAPFHFLAAALPGRQSIATAWIMNMLSHILAFPAVLAVLYFVAFLLKRNTPPFNISDQAQLISNTTLPLLGGLNVGFVNYLLAFGALSAVPAIPDVISRTIGRVGAAGQILGQEASGNIRTGRGYANQWQQTSQGFSKISQDWTHFKGQDPGYSPSTAGGWSTWKVPGTAYQPFRKKINPP